MAELVDKSGQLVQVDDAQAAQLVTGGDLGLRSDKPTNLIDAKGQLVNADAADALELLKGGNGYRLANDTEVAADLERQQHGVGLGNQVAAGLEGAASGATLGLSDVAAKELAPEYAADLAKRRLHNPTSALIGEGAGILGATLLTGGGAAEAQGLRGALGGAARLATAPARAAIGAGEMLTGGIAKRLGVDAGASLLTRAAAKGGAAAAGEALEGTLFGAAKVATDDFLNDHEITVDRIATGAGLGALMGGAFGGLTGTGGTLLEAGARKLASPILTALKRTDLGEAIDNFADERAYKAALGGRNVREVRNSKRYGGPGEIGNTLIKEMGAENLAKAGIEDIAQFATKRSDELGKQLGRMTDEIEASGSAIRPDGKALKQKIQDEILTPLRKHFSQDADAVEREFGDFLEAIDPTTKAHVGSTPRLRGGNPNDDSLGGLMGAPAPKVKRGALGEEILDSAGDANAKAAQVGTARGAVSEGDGTMGGLLGQKAKPDLGFAELNDWRKAIGNRVDWKVMDNTPKAVLDAKQDLYRLVGDYWSETADKAADSIGRPGFRAELEAVKKRYSQLEHVEKISKQAIDRDASNRFFSASDYGVGAALMGGASLAQGDMDVGTLAYGLAGGALHKLLRQRGSALISGALYSARSAPKMLKDARAGEEVVERSVGGLIARLNEGAKKTGAAVTRGARAAKQSTAPVLGLTVSAPAHVAPLIDRVRELQDANSERRQRFAQNLAPIRVTDPNLAAAMESKVQRTADYLAEKAKGVVREPAAGDVWGHLREKSVDKMKAARFLAIARAAENPGTVFDSVEDGTVTKDQVDTLRALSPRLYQRLVVKVMSELGNVKVLPTYENRIKLGIILGAPTDPSMEPKNLARLQALSKSGSQQAKSEASGPPPSSRTPPKVADQYSTSTQAILGMSGAK